MALSMSFIQKIIQEEVQKFQADTLDFVSSVEWTEPWIIALILFHIFVFAFIILTRKRSEIQNPLFFILLFLIYCGQWINDWGKQNWERFATQPYFDSTGVFFIIMYSLPLLIASLIVLINIVIMMANLAVQVKKAKLRHKHKEKSKNIKNSPN